MLDLNWLFSSLIVDNYLIACVVNGAASLLFLLPLLFLRNSSSKWEPWMPGYQERRDVSSANRLRYLWFPLCHHEYRKNKRWVPIPYLTLLAPSLPPCNTNLVIAHSAVQRNRKGAGRRVKTIWDTDRCR